MAPVAGPFNSGLSQIIQTSIWQDTTDQTFDPSALLRRYPVTLTRLEDWARSHITSEFFLFPATFKYFSQEEANETINEVVHQVVEPVFIRWPDGQFNGLRGRRACLHHQ
ncbi:MAG: hypothetical protein IPM76_03165 [Chloroflexi bacterium]|nr:hypothetical protein [Chloroflexota bacterium]